MTDAKCPQNLHVKLRLQWRKVANCEHCESAPSQGIALIPLRSRHGSIVRPTVQVRARQVRLRQVRARQVRAWLDLVAVHLHTLTITPQAATATATRLLDHPTRCPRRP